MYKRRHRCSQQCRLHNHNILFRQAGSSTPIVHRDPILTYSGINEYHNAHPDMYNTGRKPAILTRTRRQKVLTFMQEYLKSPSEYAVFQSNDWIRSLIASMKERKKNVGIADVRNWMHHFPHVFVGAVKVEVQAHPQPQQSGPPRLTPQKSPRSSTGLLSSAQQQPGTSSDVEILDLSDVEILDDTGNQGMPLDDAADRRMQHSARTDGMRFSRPNATTAATVSSMEVEEIHLQGELSANQVSSSSNGNRDLHPGILVDERGPSRRHTPNLRVDTQGQSPPIYPPFSLSTNPSGRLVRGESQAEIPGINIQLAPVQPIIPQQPSAMPQSGLFFNGNSTAPAQVITSTVTERETQNTTPASIITGSLNDGMRSESTPVPPPPTPVTIKKSPKYHKLRLLMQLFMNELIARIEGDEDDD